MGESQRPLRLHQVQLPRADADLREVVARHTGVGRDSLDAECRRITELLGS